MITNPLAALIRYQSGKQVGWSWQERKSYYDQGWAYYTNAAYERMQDGGFRELIAANFGLTTAQLLQGIINPAKRVIDLYRYTLNGSFGDEIKVEPEENGNKDLPEHLQKIFAWSNINIEKQKLTLDAAAFGTAGIRIVARSRPTARVYLKFEHPKRIKDLELDDRGNVDQILLEYYRTEGDLGENRTTHKITELLTPRIFKTWRDDRPYDLVNDSPNGPMREYVNVLGVTPYVILRHRYTGDDWGQAALFGQEIKIDLLNMLIGHIYTQIVRHIRAKWLITASGNPPIEVDLGDTSVAYIKTDPVTNTAPTMAPMIASLSLADSIALAQLLLDELRDALPELKATDGKFLAGQSGETVSQLRQPAEQLVMDARTNYEDALVRASKIGLSWGVLLGLWDLGAGMRTLEAAEKSFSSGFEDFKFNKRPALPPTAHEELNLAQKDATASKTRAEYVEIAGRANAMSMIEQVTALHPDWDEDDVAAEVEAIMAAGVPAPDELVEAGMTGAEDDAPEPAAEEPEQLSLPVE